LAEIIVRHHRLLAMNALDQDQMTAAERLAEVSSLLAAAVIRLQQRKSSPLSGEFGESCLDISPPKSGRGRKPRCRIGGQ
jgi:hypothetical protein